MSREHWEPILTHPDVEPHVLAGLATVDDFLAYIEKPEVETERYDGGGIIYVGKPPFKEVHIAFLPDQWGRDAASAFKRSVAQQMAKGVSLIAREQEGYWKSRPPKSYGWVTDGDFQIDTHPKRLRRWILTPEAWYRSPIGRKYNVDHR